MTIGNIIKLAELERGHADDRPLIRITAGEIAPIATQAEGILIDAGVPLYQRAGTLVRPIIETVDASHGRTTQIAQLKVLDNTYMRDLLCRHTNWQRYDARKSDWVRADPPLAIAATILARAGDWKVPAIAGVISTPTMRPDGSLLIEPGFDAATRLLLVAPPPMPPIPERPTRDDALAALARLEELLPEFPFVDDSAKAVALSAMITPVVRGAFPVAPMHVARAPTSGSGKSYLWDIVAAIVIGQPMPVMAAGRTEEETEKRLGAALVAAQPLISIDNVNGELGGDALCQVIERPNLKIRILGKTEQVQIEARGTSTFASGNNIVIVGDVCRRVITTTLDPQLERPELREFRSNPVATVLADRGAYIAAALTVCRAYVVAGRPAPARKLASFEGWSDTVRSALIWLGKADCVQSMETAREEDPEHSELSALLMAWSEAIGIGYDHRLTLAKVIEIATETEPAGYPKGTPKHPELLAAIQAVATQRRTQQTDAKTLGRWMQCRRVRVVNGMRFANVSNPKGGRHGGLRMSSGRTGTTKMGLFFPSARESPAGAPREARRGSGGSEGVCFGMTIAKRRLFQPSEGGLGGLGGLFNARAKCQGINTLRNAGGRRVVTPQTPGVSPRGPAKQAATDEEETDENADGASGQQHDRLFTGMARTPSYRSTLEKEMGK